jgi:hypothetical protein
MTERELALDALAMCKEELRRLEAEGTRRLVRKALRLCHAEQLRLGMRDLRRVETLLKRFNPGEPRDEDGRWTSGGAGSGGRGDHGGSKPASGSKARPKSVSLLTRLRSPARRRRVIAALRTESDMAQATSSWNAPDSWSFDCVYLEDAAGKPVTGRENVRRFLETRAHARRVLSRQGSPAAAREAAERILSLPAHAFEIKTLLVSKAGTVRMSRKARARKWRDAEKYGLAPHVLVRDGRRGSKHSGHDLYLSVAELSPSHNVAEMDKLDSYASAIAAACPECKRGK